MVVKVHGKESESAEIDWINIAKEQVKGAAGKHYSPVLHPSSFSSTKAKRGPLKGAWTVPTFSSVALRRVSCLAYLINFFNRKRPSP